MINSGLLAASTAAWISAIAVAVLVTAAVVALIAAGIYAKETKKRAEDIKNSLKSITQGHYRPVKSDSRNPEMYAIYNEINEIADGFLCAMRASDAERKKLNFVLNNVSQCILAVDENKVVKIMNAPAKKLFSRDDSFVGRDLYFAVSDAKLLSKLATAHKDGPYSFEYRMEDKYLLVDICRTEGGIHDEITDIIIISDVSAEKLAAKQRSDFFSNAGHELKTPLTSIQGLTELLLVKTDPESLAFKYAQRIHNEAERLGALVLDMLKLSNIENLQSLKAVEESATEVELSDIAAEVIAALEVEAEKKNLTVTLEGKGVVVADPRKIYEIINNLYSNAVNYNVLNGSIKVVIGKTDCGTVLTVADTGIGIDKKHIPRLCERFYRVDKSRSKKTGGTGLGLAIVKHVCALYGAELNISSEEGVGTTVTVTFKK